MVELVHRDLYAGQAEALDDLGRPVQQLRHLLELFFRKMAQDIIDLPAFGVIVANAEAQARVVLCTQELCDILKAVVTGIATLWLEAECPEGQGDIVDNDQQVLDGNILFLQPIADSVTAQVHECVWLEKNQLAVFYSSAGDGAITLLAERDALAFRQSVDDPETDIMACA